MSKSSNKPRFKPDSMRSAMSYAISNNIEFLPATQRDIVLNLLCEEIPDFVKHLEKQFSIIIRTLEIVETNAKQIGPA